MYVIILSLISKISESEILMRSVNFVAIFITSVLILSFCIKTSKKNKILIGMASTSLFLINYYVVSSSVLIDIDALSTLFIFMFIFSIILYQEHNKIFYFILGIISFMLSLANRYPLILIVSFFLLIYFIINKERRIFVKKYLIICLSGGIIFLILWSSYSLIIGPNHFLAFIAHNVGLGAQQFLNAKVYFFSFLLNISQIIRLITLPFLILFALSIYYFLKNRTIKTDILLIYTLSIIFFFIIIPRPAFGYPRYFLSAMPGFFILISLFLYNSLYKNVSKLILKPSNLLIILFSLLVSLFILVYFAPNLTIYRSDGLILSTNLPDFIFNILATLPIIFVILISKDRRK